MSGAVLTPSSLFRAAAFDAGVFGIHSVVLERDGVVGVGGNVGVVDELAAIFFCFVVVVAGGISFRTNGTGTANFTFPPK